MTGKVVDSVVCGSVVHVKMTGYSWQVECCVGDCGLYDLCTCVCVCVCVCEREREGERDYNWLVRW